jgi:SAM-dependent methyltransferase
MQDSTYSYDVVPYPRLAYVHTHPDRIASLATLLGLDPPLPDHCRVLELGCGSGANLLSMAHSLPGSSFVGIDLSAHQVAIGQADIQRLGLSNVTLLHLNLMDVGAELGEFDYIIAHGVYSWIPVEVRDRLLTICKRHLAPNGVAYVSYNAYPGWRGLEAVRDMMQFHTRHLTDPQQRTSQARGLIDFLASSLSREENLYGAFLNMHNDFLKQELDESLSDNDAYFFHDHLEEINDPVYFYQFAEHAGSHGLQYLCDADFRTDLPSNFPTPVAEKLAFMARDLIDLEQYMDFLRNRMFRRTLLCHDDASINRVLTGESVRSLFIAAPTLPESQAPDLAAVKVERFLARDGAKLNIDHPLSKAAMIYLGQCWPIYLPFDQLASEAWAFLHQAADAGPVPQRDIDVLAVNLLRAYTYSENLVEIHAAPPSFTVDTGGTPLSSPWARIQAESAQRVTNLRQEPIKLDGFELHLLRLLDGTRDRPALVDALQRALDAGEIHMPDESTLEEVLDRKLERIARSALLVG